MNWFSKLKQDPKTPEVPQDPSQDPLQPQQDKKRYMELHEMDRQKAYDTFKDSYEQATGTSWDQGKFNQRAGNWRFYGDENGYITVRPQNSGMLKLTGVAGSPRSILKGLKELSQEAAPIWGMVSKDIANMATKYGFKKPPGLLVKSLIHKVPPHVFGNATITGVGLGGGVTFDYPDVGLATKYLIGNRQYFETVMNDSRMPASLKMMIQKFI